MVAGAGVLRDASVPSDRLPGGEADVAVASPLDAAPARHLTVVCGSGRHDVVVDPGSVVGAVLGAVLGDVLDDGPHDGPGDGSHDSYAAGREDARKRFRWVARTLTGVVLTAGVSVEAAGLVDGSVIVAEVAGTAPPATVPTDQAAAPTGADGRPGPVGRPGGGAATGVVLKVCGVLAIGVSLETLLVTGMPRAGVRPLDAAVLALAVAAAIGRVVPDLVVRRSSGSSGWSGSGVGEGSSSHVSSVPGWVCGVARWQLVAHLAVLGLVLVAGVALVVGLTGMPVSLPVLASVLASGTVLAGSARGRGRGDQWCLRGASAAAVVPVLSAFVVALSTPVAVALAGGSVVVGLVAISPLRRRPRPGSARSRLARGVDLLAVVAVLPLASWASGALTAVQAWAHLALT